MIRIVKIFCTQWYVPHLHILPSVVADVEDSRRESKPINKPGYLLSNVRFASCRHYINVAELRPTIQMMIFLGSAICISCILLYEFSQLD